VKQGHSEPWGALVLVVGFRAAARISSRAVEDCRRQAFWSGARCCGHSQLGCQVEVVSRRSGSPPPRKGSLHTQGVFRGDKLAPGFYTVRVTLAGFLPTLEKHIRINANLTTVVRIRLESMFASLEQLRRQPARRGRGG